MPRFGTNTFFFFLPPCRRTPTNVYFYLWGASIGEHQEPWRLPLPIIAVCCRWGSLTLAYTDTETSLTGSRIPRKPPFLVAVFLRTVNLSAPVIPVKKQGRFSMDVRGIEQKLPLNHGTRSRDICTVTVSAVGSTGTQPPVMWATSESTQRQPGGWAQAEHLPSTAQQWDTQGHGITRGIYTSITVQVDLFAPQGSNFTSEAAAQAPKSPNCCS